MGEARRRTLAGVAPTPTGSTGACHFEESMQARFSLYRLVEEEFSLPEGYFEESMNSAKFVFTEHPLQALEDFAIELIKEDLFRLPFDNCYFEWMYKGNVCSILAQHLSGDYERVGVWTADTLDGKWGSAPPGRFNLTKLREHLVGGGTLEDYPLLGDEKYDKVYRSVMCEVLSCVALLASKGIEREAVPPEELNLKRVAQGRAPFPTYTIIHLSRYRAARGIPHGTHASPIPHFRRGHVRTLSPDRKVIVRPHFVMADPGSMPTYKVKAGGVR